MTQKPPHAFDVTDDDMMGEFESSEQVADIAKPKTTKDAEVELIENPERAALEKKLTETEQKLSNAEEKVLRVHAEMENLLRRTDKKTEDAYKYAVQKLLEELLPVLDSLEQSLTVQESEDPLVKNMREGMALTLQMLRKVLEKFGIKEINPVGEIFNPTYHEVMLAQPTTEAAPNTILAVLQKGYMLHERVIRPARVSLAKAPS